MAGERIPATKLTPEAVPGIDYTSTREVETRALLSGPEERDALETKLAGKSEREPDRMRLSDIRFSIEGFNGSARIRVVTRPHRTPPPDPVFEWAVKEFMPRTGLTVAKAPVEHQGVAASFKDAAAALDAVLRALGHEDGEVEVKEISSHDRTVYELENGVVASVDTYDRVCKDGEEMPMPQVSVEFERTIPIDATDEEIKDAEKEIIDTAASVDIPVDRLAPSRKLETAEPT